MNPEKELVSQFILTGEQGKTATTTIRLGLKLSTTKQNMRRSSEGYIEPILSMMV